MIEWPSAEAICQAIHARIVYQGSPETWEIILSHDKQSGEIHAQIGFMLCGQGTQRERLEGYTYFGVRAEILRIISRPWLFAIFNCGDEKMVHYLITEKIAASTRKEELIVEILTDVAATLTDKSLTGIENIIINSGFETIVRNCRVARELT
jgi:hypothetical protein